MAGTPGTFRFPEVNAKPSAPPAGYALLYIKTDNVLYLQDSTGLEIALGTASGITSLVGEATGVGPGAATITLSNSAVIGKILTGFSAGPNSSVLATDTILQAIQKLQSQISASSGAAITGLTGDVSASGPGNVPATVNSVGGSAASDVHNAELLANAATSLNTGNDIVKRDNLGNFAATNITASLTGNVTGNVTGSAASITGVNPIANGGTNSSTPLNNNRIIKSASGQIVEAAAIASNQALVSDNNGIPTGSPTTATELSYVSGVTSSIQAQLNSKANNPSSTVTQTVYVAAGGNDSTGDGSIGNPYMTVSKALTTITTASSNNRFLIKLMAGKIVETVTPLLKPWVYLVGDNEDGTYWKVTASGNNINLDPSFATVGGARFGISNVYIGAGTNLNLDLNSIGPSTGTPSAVVDLEDITVTGVLNFYGRVPDIDFMQMKGVFVFGAFNTDASQNTAIGCSFQSTINLTSNIAPTNSQYSACVFQGAVNISGTNTNAQQITASPMFSTLLVSGASTVLKADSTSLPPLTSQTVSSGGLITLLGDANNLKYTPTTPANWPVSPAVVQTALDSLATSARIPTQTSHGGSILATDGTNLSWGQVQGYSTQSEFHVDSSYAGSIQNGNLNTPYITVQSAFNAIVANPTANAIIFIHGQGTTENVTINNYTNGLSIQAFATTAKDSQVVKITGNITLSGSTTRVRLKDLKIAYPGGTQPDLIDSSAGRNYFSNVDFGGGGGIQYTSSWARWHEFVDCTINGNVDMSGTPAAGSTVSMWRTRGAPTFGLNSSNVSLTLVNNENLGTITQTAGSLTIEGGSGMVSGSSIISTANTPDTLSISNFSLRISGTTFAPINKTGSAPYALNNVWRNESIDTLTGTRTIYGSTAADQKYVPSIPSNWPILPADTKDALDYLSSEASVGITNAQSIINALIFG